MTPTLNKPKLSQSAVYACEGAIKRHYEAVVREKQALEEKKKESLSRLENILVPKYSIPREPFLDTMKNYSQKEEQLDKELG